MATSYYGLKKSDGTVVEKGWTTAPSFNLYWITNASSWDSYHIFGYCNSSLGLAYQDFKSNTPSVNRSTFPLGASITRYSFVRAASVVWKILTASKTTGGVDIGYNLTKTAAIGDTLYDGSRVAYTLCQYTVKEKYKVTVKKTNGSSTTTVSETEYEEGSNVTVSIPSGYTNYVLSGVSKDGAALAYSDVKNGYTISNLSGNVEILYTFAALNTITVKVGTGAKKISASSTTLYTGETKSVEKTSGSGTITAQVGATITFNATAATNYVFTTTTGITTSDTKSYSHMRGSGTASISNQTQYANGNATFTATGEQFTITPSIVDGGVGKSGWGVAKINGSSSAVVLLPNTTYTLSFDSSTADTLAAEVDYWSIGGSNYSTSFTTGDTVTQNITAYLYLKQTKWQLTVKNGTNADWGTVSGGGWYANGTNVTVTFTPSSSYSHLGIQAYQINYNSSTASCGNSATITTTNASLTATMYLKQTKFKMSIAYGNDGTSGWGTIAANKEYVSTGDEVTLSFTPTSSLVSTIHPKVDHWTFLQQTSSPTAADDGSSSVTVTLGTVSQDFTASCYLASAWRKVSIQRTDSGTAAWGKFYLGTSGTNTTAYYAPGTQITMRCVRDTSYDSSERPQVNAIVIGTESEIAGVDGTFTYNYTLPSNTKTDLTISCSMKQTAWPVTVSTDGNGSVVAKRMSIASGTAISTVTSTGTAQTIYLRSGTTAEYLSIEGTANDHYAFSAWTKSNLSNYNSDAKKVQLTSAASASVSATFTRSDFKVTCTTDDSSRASAYLQTDAQTEGYFDKTTTQNPVVICKLKSSYANDYKVASWSIGDQDDITPQYNAQGDFYYVEVANRVDVVVTAHIARTSFQLTIDVWPTNYSQFGTLVVTSGGQQVKKFEADSDNSFVGNVKEGTAVEVVFYEKYGGRVVQIVPSSQIVDPATTSEQISFNMPSADCSVTFSLGAKETYQLTVGVVNSASGYESTTPATLVVESRTYAGIEIGRTLADGVSKTFTVYKDEEYKITAEAVSEDLSRRFTMLGWKDESGSYIQNADQTTINITGTTTAARTRNIIYGLRTTGTVTVEYAKKENGVITVLSECPDGCSFTLENTKDKTDATHWLVGADIKMPYTVMGVGFDQDGDAYKWTPVEVDVALATDEYEANETWSDGLLTQDGEFTMRGNMKVRVVFVLTSVPGYTSMRVGFKDNTTKAMGSVSMFATDMDAYTEDSTGARALVRKQKKAVIMAAPRPGFAFAGWYTFTGGAYVFVSGAKAVYEIDYVTSPATTYYAEFVGSTISNVKEWNGNPVSAKTFDWQSKVYVGTQFYAMQSCRVYADAYPVTLKLFASSSPDDIFGESSRKATITIASQSPRRIPRMRPEKYFAFRVSGYARINHVGISSSMEGLLS